MTPNNIAGMAALKGLQMLALTDHNSCKNCPAFFEACRRQGIIPIAGMELSTAEDIHLVCLFPSLEQAMTFDQVIEQHRMQIPNRPEIFGNQLILDGADELLGTEEILLISATDLPIEEAVLLFFAQTLKQDQRFPGSRPYRVRKPKEKPATRAGFLFGSPCWA